MPPDALVPPDAPVRYTVRRSPRARRVRVTVDAGGGVEVVLPRRAAEREAAAAIVELRPWIERRLADAAALRERARLASPPGTVPYLGELLRLVPEPGRTRAHRRGDVLLVPAGGGAAGGAQGDAIERWYRRVARDELAPRVDEATTALGVASTGLAVRAQRTRWGSCSAAGVLSFNWRLLLAPPEILDYVVWHEACHLRVMDHSPRFWSLLERHRPGYRVPRRWLRENGAALTLAL